MKKICFLIAMALMSAGSFAQSAKSVLDKAASHITVKDGVKANFKMTGSMGNTSGTILIKGRKFQATTPVATVWFDGKTQWTYVKKNDEVNVSTPTEAQLQAINPYNFINLYKKGYDCTLNKSGKDYVVHLTSNTVRTSRRKSSCYAIRNGLSSTSQNSRSRVSPTVSSVSTPRTSHRQKSST